ncbi:MAG: hypothetical protein WDM89_18450 [Rhizomicrobium sp.]
MLRIPDFSQITKRNTFGPMKPFNGGDVRAGVEFDPIQQAKCVAPSLRKIEALSQKRQARQVHRRIVGVARNTSTNFAYETSHIACLSSQQAFNARE